MARKALSILISGRGSNLQAIAEAASNPDFPAEIKLVLSNRPKARGLDVARQYGLATAVVDHTKFDTREDFEKVLHQELVNAGTELIANAGFMRLLTGSFVNKWAGRQINIHPSLLPAFKGLNTHERAIDAGVKLHGCTVHYVTEAMDDGPIIGQAAVRVMADDTPETLSQRVLTAEHALYPACIAKVCGAEVMLDEFEPAMNWLAHS